MRAFGLPAVQSSLSSASLASYKSGGVTWFVYFMFVLFLLLCLGLIAFVYYDLVKPRPRYTAQEKKYAD